MNPLADSRKLFPLRRTIVIMMTVVILLLALLIYDNWTWQRVVQSCMPQLETLRQAREDLESGFIQYRQAIAGESLADIDRVWVLFKRAATALEGIPGVPSSANIDDGHEIGLNGKSELLRLKEGVEQFRRNVSELWAYSKSHDIRTGDIQNLEIMVGQIQLQAAALERAIHYHIRGQFSGQSTAFFLIVVFWLVISSFAAYLLIQIARKHRRFEAGLDESQRMLQMVLDTIPARVFWKDCRSMYMGCNRLFATDAGLDDPGDIIGKTDFQLAWKEQAEMYRTDDRTVIESGRPKPNYEEPQTGPDGRKLWLRTSKFPLKDRNGKIIGILGTYEDITERRTAEEALRTNQALLHSIMESLPFELFAIDADGKYVLENSICRARWGDIIGKRPSEISAPPEVLAIWEDNNRRAFSGKTVKGEIEYVLDGHKEIYYNIIAPIRDEDKIRGILGVNVDISDRRAAEEALRESLQTSADIVAAIPSGLLIFRYHPPHSLILMDANPEAEFLIGIRIDEWRGRGLDDIMPAAKEYGITEAFLDVMTTGNTFITESLSYKDDRIDSIFRMRAFHMPGERLGVALENITERTRAYEALRDSEERYRFLYRSMPIMLHTVDAEGRLVNVSQEWLARLGYDRVDVIGKKVTDIISPDSPPRARESMLPQSPECCPCKHVPCQFIRKNGDRTDVLLSTVPQFDRDGAVINCYSVLINVAEVRKAKAGADGYPRTVKQNP